MILGPGADPWVVRHEGCYLWCRSENHGVALRVADTLEGLANAPSQPLWQAPAIGPYSKEIWAPELHFYGDRWYVYVAADDGENANHRMIALRSEGTDPLGPYTCLGPLALTPDRWAIDGTLVDLSETSPLLGGRGQALYFVWSGWEGSENVAQHLYICPMADPVTPAGERVRISSPEYDWERRGSGGPGNLPTINEGPQVLQRNGTTHLIYSAAGSWCDDYCLGRLTLPPGADPLDAGAWQKHPEPVFQRTDTIFAPGHCSFVDDWIVYHTARHSGAGWDRIVRAQPFTWDRDTPVFGKPG
jgi:GH43 family beta-xylosidase